MILNPSFFDRKIDNTLKSTIWIIITIDLKNIEN